MVLKDLIKLFSVICTSTILFFILNVSGYFVASLAIYIILKEILKPLPVYIFGKRFLGILVFSIVCGLIFGVSESLINISENKPESIFFSTLISIITSLISGISIYPFKKTNSSLFLIFIFFGIFFSIIISYYYEIYKNIWLTLLIPQTII